MALKNCAGNLAAAFIGAFLCSAALGDAPQTLRGRDFLSTPGSDWKLAWNDEFDGDRLDTAKWSIGLSWTGDDGTNRHHNSQYASYIMDDDVAVSGGTLKLLTRRGPFRNPSGKSYDYSEGLIQTHGKFSGKYGYYETRVRIPAEAGPGMWPAFWMLSEGWPPEMDIMEVWTSSNRNHQGLAYRKQNATVGWDDINSSEPLPTGWHTFGMEWLPGCQIYNIDGRVNVRVFGTHVPDVPMYLILNSGVESGWQPNAATVFPNALEVDYVRVYQRPDGPVALNGSFEAQDPRPWTLTGRALTVAYGARSGRQALRLDDGKASAEQTLYGLKPRTRYILAASGRVIGDDTEARVGVREFGGDDATETIRGTKYTSVTVPFTTGPSATTAILSVTRPSGSGSAFVDDISIREAPE